MSSTQIPVLSHGERHIYAGLLFFLELTCTITVWEWCTCRYNAISYYIILNKLPFWKSCRCQTKNSQNTWSPYSNINALCCMWLCGIWVTYQWLRARMHSFHLLMHWRYHSLVLNHQYDPTDQCEETCIKFKCLRKLLLLLNLTAPERSGSELKNSIFNVVLLIAFLRYS